MSDKPKVKPYELDAEHTPLTHLPGDEPPLDRAVTPPPPTEYALDEANFTNEGVELPPGTAPGPKQRRFWTKGTIFTLSFALFATGFLVYQSVRAVLDALAWWAPSGILLALLLASMVVTGLIAAGGELRRIRRQLRSLGTIESARREAALLMQSRGYDRGHAFAARVIRIYETRPDMATSIQAFRQAANSSLRDQEVVARLSSHVLRRLDGQACEIIGRAMRDTVFISLASPNGLVDGLITLWRELKMLREVGSVYGLAPGIVQQWLLLRRVISIAATSGLVSQAGDMASQSLGGGLLGHMSANAADSLYTAFRTARLGMYAMESCRPVTFQAEERKGMRTLLKEAVSSIARLLATRGGVREAPPDQMSRPARGDGRT